MIDDSDNRPAGDEPPDRDTIAIALITVMERTEPDSPQREQAVAAVLEQAPREKTRYWSSSESKEENP